MGKSSRLSVTLQSLVIHPQEFLLDSQVMVADSQDADSVFELLLDLLVVGVCGLFLFDQFVSFLLIFFVFFLLWHELHQETRLDNHDSALRVVHG